MRYSQLGRTGVSVSRVCLGTMTFGEQNTEAEAHQQLDYAVERGINFLDTAEMYPVPPRGETQGRTEAYIGSWLKARGRRDDLVIATKVAGPQRDGTSHIRPGKVRLDRANIEAAIDASLKRLETDYVDLYQLHWPDRNTVTFGKRAYQHLPEADEVPIEETLAVLGDLVKAGKVRFVGLSNETPWGVMRFIEASDRLGLPRMASIQNAYSLVNRMFETGLDEVALREDVGLLSYSPLAGGTLSGKYLDGAKPAGARMTLFTRFTRYNGAQGQAAIRRYVELARASGLDPSQMALAYVDAKAFMTSTIIGATTMEQLKTDIDAFDLTLEPAVVEAIEAIHLDSPNPCP
jgi:aryl-alcohol dehydrogenase-like predicted oxidoreductase